MPRVPRRLLGEGVYHVVNRGHNRARVFEVPEGKEVFLGFLREYRRNPVRAGLAEKPWTYPWSSARTYVLGEDDGLTDADFNGAYLSLSGPTYA